MRITALLCNALLLPFTLLVVVTDGPATELPYIVLVVLLLAVPALSLLALGRSRRAEAPGLRSATVLANLALLALAWWAVVEQYPHPRDPGVLPYTVLVLITPVLSAWTVWRARKQPSPS